MKRCINLNVSKMCKLSTLAKHNPLCIHILNDVVKQHHSAIRMRNVWNIGSYGLIAIVCVVTDRKKCDRVKIHKLGEKERHTHRDQVPNALKCQTMETQHPWHNHRRLIAKHTYLCARTRHISTNCIIWIRKICYQHVPEHYNNVTYLHYQGCYYVSYSIFVVSLVRPIHIHY